MILNAEQLTAIYKDQDIIILKANAGSGKTTTLIGYAESNINSDILYIVFSKNMRKESKKKFPSNTEVHTIDSLAYKHTKSIFGHRKVISELSTKQIIDFVPSLKSKYKTNRIGSINDAINFNNAFNSFLLNNESNTHPDIYNLYLRLINKDSTLPITHSIILKYFSSTFDMSLLKFDHVLIDEAQDTNQQMLEIINKISGKKFYVGDPKQSIYGFRNTINIFNKYKDIEQCSLSGSFRFGENIAKYISDKTSIAYKEDFNITGLSEIKGEIIVSEKQIEGPYAAYITRTNAHLFDKAFESSEQNLKVSIPFDWDELKSLITNAFYLKIGLINKINVNSIFSKYESFEVLLEISKSGGDQEITFIINILEKYGIGILDKLSKLEQNLSAPKYADIIYITAHKSKGLEFYSVEIGSDFKKYEYKTEIEEKNLIYVAMTRAMEVLKVNNLG